MKKKLFILLITVTPLVQLNSVSAQQDQAVSESESITLKHKLRNQPKFKRVIYAYPLALIKYGVKLRYDHYSSEKKALSLFGGYWFRAIGEPAGVSKGFAGSIGYKQLISSNPASSFYYRLSFTAGYFTSVAKYVDRPNFLENLSFIGSGPTLPPINEKVNFFSAGPGFAFGHQWQVGHFLFDGNLGIKFMFLTGGIIKDHSGRDFENLWGESNWLSSPPGSLFELSLSVGYAIGK